MDYDQYVAARRGRLLEEATARGRTPDEAEAVVDRLLLRHRRDIVRAEDPHPFLVAALADLLDGRPVAERRTPGLLTWLPLALLALVVALVAGAVLLSLDGGTDDSDDTGPTPGPTSGPSSSPSDSSSPVAAAGTLMPYLLGYKVDEVQQALAGHAVTRVDESGTFCGPRGLVLGTLPAPGAPLPDGDRVTLSTAAGPTGSTCPADRVDDEAAGWSFVRYVTGRGGAPRFADTVRVVIDGGRPLQVPGSDAARNGFGGLSQYFADFRSLDAISSGGRYPQLSALDVTPPTTRCGVTRPRTFGDRAALRVTLESLDLGDDDTCALTVDLYREPGGRIDGVSLYRTFTSGPAEPTGQPDIVD